MFWNRHNMKIGLLSDTHGQLPAEIFEIFKDAELIIHAGDIGSVTILPDLKAIAPVKAVYGNVDSFPLVGQLPRIDFIQAEQLTVCLTHIVNSFKGFSFELFKLKKKADIVIFGHTHHSELHEYNNILFVNPGSVSFPRGGSASVAMLEVNGAESKVDFFKLNGT